MFLSKLWLGTTNLNVGNRDWHFKSDEGKGHGQLQRRTYLEATIQNILTKTSLLPARCVSHTLKECVGSHTLTSNFVCGILEFSKISH